MKIIIIEDERLTATDLENTLHQVDPSLEIIAVIKSVQEGKTYFQSNPLPDLIFSDIRLGDGLSFQIVNDLQVPVIFCTAYDEYALNAFRANGIDYILKPFTLNSVANAIQKFNNIRGPRIAQQYEVMKQIFSSFSTRPSSLLIHHKDMILPIKMADVAMFHLEHDLVKLTTFNQVVYYPNKSLDELEALAGEDFFRVNRQYLINRNAIQHASSILSRKLSVNISIPHKEDITISREKAPLFLKWLAEF